MNSITPEVVVYCASSSEIDKVYFDAAARLGRLLAENNITCINGAGKQGLMGVLNDSLLRHGGKVKGIIPRFMVDAGWCHNQLTETIVTETIHERKARMARDAAAVIALPGGMGTLEELAEIITWKQLGLYKNPIVLLNTNDYYKPLLAFFEKIIEEKFMNSSYRELWQVASTPEEAVELIRKFPDWDPSFTKYHEKVL
jgi:TIGR00730 family protein